MTLLERITLALNALFGPVNLAAYADTGGVGSLIIGVLGTACALTLIVLGPIRHA